ncbi:MAG: hypothetical protein KR126chlam1_01504 [Chlamydiae bacterium]|nr:hypothetical protein [Chlamydiota bacterium]
MNDIPLKKDWKYYLGITFLVLSLVLPLCGFLVPFFDLPIALKGVLIAMLSIGGPEIMVILAAVCLGKKYIVYIKNKIRNFFRLKKPPKPVSKRRYYFGIVVMLCSAIPLYMAAYFPNALPVDETRRFLLTVSGDLTFVLSFFILGANFWEKFKRLFVWDGDR